MSKHDAQRAKIEALMNGKARPKRKSYIKTALKLVLLVVASLPAVAAGILLYRSSLEIDSGTVIGIYRRDRIEVSGYTDGGRVVIKVVEADADKYKVGDRWYRDLKEERK